MRRVATQVSITDFKFVAGHQPASDLRPPPLGDLRQGLTHRRPLLPLPTSGERKFRVVFLEIAPRNPAPSQLGIIVAGGSENCDQMCDVNFSIVLRRLFLRIKPSEFRRPSPTTSGFRRCRRSRSDICP